MTLPEALGYLASLLIAVAMMMQGLVRLRLTGLLGSLTMAVYGGLIGAGPILVATDCGDDAVAACRFAGRMGARMGRKVVAVHVIPPIDPILRAYLAEGPWVELGEQEHARGVARLQAWLEQHELVGFETKVVQGATIEELGKLAVESLAPLVVTGARRLPMVARAFVGSTAVTLAAEMPVPVAVVPPEG